MTPAEIIDMVASLQNDTAQTYYTDSACLPYLNMALDELQEIFELNDVPTVEESSSIIKMIAGKTELGYATNPALPSALIQIKRIWESISGQSNFTPMNRVEFLPHSLEGITTNYFRIWALNGDSVKLLPANGNIDLKLDYIRSIFNTPILIANINAPLNFNNVKQYLGYKTAALCSAFIGENTTRAEELALLADSAIQRVLGIKIKPKQSIVTNRRPFRQSYKMNSNY